MPTVLSTPYNGMCDISRNRISIIAVHTIFSLNETSLSGAFTSGITRTKGDRAFRKVDVNSVTSPAGFLGWGIDYAFKGNGLAAHWPNSASKLTVGSLCGKIY